MARPATGRRAQLRALAAAAGHRYRDVLATRDARILLGAGVVSAVGDWFNTVALIILADRYGEGALGVGGLLAVRVLPGLVLQGPAGALVDRLPGRRLLVVVQLLMAVVATSFVVLNAWPSLWLLYALVLALESLNTIARPAFLVQFTAAVPDDRRASANGLLWMGWTVAQVAGTLLGGALLGPLGATALFVLNGLTFVAIALAVLRVGDHAAAAPTADLGLSQPPEAAEPGLGYGTLLRRADVAGFAALTFSSSLLVRAASALFVVRSEELGLGEGGVGPFLAAVAVGFLVGGALAGAGVHTGRSTLYLIAATEGVAALGLAAFGAAGGPTLALVGLAITGVASEMGEVVALTYFQHRLPAAVQGRFFSLFLMAAAAGGVVGALLGPLLEARIGADGAIVLPAVLGAALALAFGLAVRERWRDRDEEDPDAGVAARSGSRATRSGAGGSAAGRR